METPKPVSARLRRGRDLRRRAQMSGTRCEKKKSDRVTGIYMYVLLVWGDKARRTRFAEAFLNSARRG
jgi:hypothetical protein